MAHPTHFDAPPDPGSYLQGGSYKCPCCKYTCKHLYQMQYHMDNHMKLAAQHKGLFICKCSKACRKVSHFHCLHCNATIIRKDQLEPHLSGHLSPLSTAGPVLQPPASTAGPVGGVDLQMNERLTTDDHPVNCVEIPAQTKGDLCESPPAKRKLVDAEFLMECVEEELEPWQQILMENNPESDGSSKRIRTAKKATGKPAVVTRLLAPAPAPAPLASSHMVISGQALSGNISSKDTVVPLFTNTSSVLTPMASVPVTALPSGFLLVLPVTSSN
ncbi:uncharacterized protein LOC134082535 isoform X3 [Sardina pilchardus]|uniref:uncharacterized protein LOC134082535 isoform X3 n=1 Tax=Sardina pilchardus TaxID=27697 RepID=UPI002E15B08E